MSYWKRILVAGVLAVVGVASSVLAWQGPGHHRATELAIAMAGDSLPGFLTAGAGTICHNALDPDLCRFAETPSLKGGVYAEHFMDIEPLAGAAIPPTRYAYLALCCQRGLRADSIGFLPYAIAEGTERLAVAMAEYRLWPDSPDIQAKCLAEAGRLAHYAQDLCNPLHVTVNYDGRGGPDGLSPRSGIHEKVDALLGKCPPPTHEALTAEGIKPFAELFPAIAGQLQASHAMVDRVYAMEAQLPAANESITPGSAVEAFATERLAASARFTARLYATAWALSAEIKLPPWHLRERHQLDGLPLPTTAPAPAKTTTAPAASVPAGQHP